MNLNLRLLEKKMSRIELFNGDCLEVMRGIADGSVDSIITDPPAGIAFMNKEWDKNKGGRNEWIAWMTEVMSECHRVLKHGGHALVWTLPRTQHWTALACEDAGFELRDNVIHIFGSGFPKSLNISKQIDKEAGAVREVVGLNTRSGKERGTYGAFSGESFETTPTTDHAKQHEGWGTALKPAYENWLLLRKPLSEKTVAKNVIKHGVGGINIDGCRVHGESWGIRTNGNPDGKVYGLGIKGGTQQESNPQGRFPANLIHDGSDEVMALFPDTQARKANARNCSGTPSVAKGKEYPRVSFGHNDSGGSAARFFYCAKASKADRNSGCDDLEATNNMRVNAPRISEEEKTATRHGNHHPTVKPNALMRYLCRLITPPNGIVLDPFTGSGSTGKAAIAEGFRFIGIEKERDFFDIATKRIEAAQQDLITP